MTKQNEQKYTMRALKTNDVFAMSKILRKMKIKLDVKEGMTQQDMGVQMIQKILENIHMAQNDVNEFLGGLVGLKGAEFGELPIEETFEIISLFKNQKGLSNFLELASK